MQEIGDEKQEKPVVVFEETEQGLVLNKTNAAVLAAALGDDSDDWIGHKVELRREKTQHKGQIVPCIRVHVPEPPTSGADNDDLAP